jgi:hypothetical protein
VYPFGVTEATESIAQTTAEIVNDGDRAALLFSSSGFSRYDRVNFGTREPLSFRVSVKSASGGVMTVYEGGLGETALGHCEVPQSDGYITVSGDMHTAVNGIADIVFVFSPYSGGDTLLRDWRFMLPARASYTDPIKLTHAANYPYRSGDIVRRPSTDGGSAAKLQVEGITDGSYVLYAFVRFRESNVTIPFHIRAKPIAGGTVEILAGCFVDGADYAINTFMLGSVEISGQSGVWADFSGHLDFEGFHLWNFDNTREDLKLLFVGEEGVELFAISEFYLGHTKPRPAGIFDAVVTTGNVTASAANSTVISDNTFMDFDEFEIIEAGVMYSWAGDFHLYHLNDPDITTFVPADSMQTPFAVTIDELKPSPYPDIPFQNYRAYVKTRDGIFFGNAKRLMPESTPPVEVAPNH